MPAMTALRFDAVTGVKFVHRVQPVAEAAEWYDHIHMVRVSVRELLSEVIK